MVSFREYARETGVSYEAVRQQVKRYAAELEGHIHQQGRTQLLDDAAVAFLDAHRQHRTMTIYDADPSAKMEELHAKLEAALMENRALLKEIGELGKAKARLEAAEAAQARLEAAKDEYKALAEKNAQEAAVEREKAMEALLKLAEVKAMGPLKRAFWNGG